MLFFITLWVTKADSETTFEIPLTHGDFQPAVTDSDK